MKKIITTLLFLLPLSAFAADLPAFPMAFYGSVSINGTAAPAGSIVRAYYGTTLAGQTTVVTPGIYGYTEPTKQKLVLSSGTGTISFLIQSSVINNGQETGGTTAQNYTAFASGETVHKDLAFTTPPPPPPAPSPTPSPAPSSGGGGGGGGGGPTTVYGCTDNKATNYNQNANQNNGTCIYPPKPTTTTATIVSTSTSLKGEVLGASTTTTPVKFGPTVTLYLSTGSTGAQVILLQRFLIDQKFLTMPSGVPLGYFGQATKKALMAYQQSVGLEQTGATGPKTRLAIAGKTNNGGSVLGVTTTSATTNIFMDNLQVGSTGDDVTRLQQILIKKGFLNMPPLVPVGYFGLMTKNALTRYQANAGLLASGVLDSGTRAYLNAHQ